MADRRGRRPTTRQAVALGCLAVVGTGVGLGVSEATASGAPAYRTATVGVSSVDRSLALSGVLEPVNQATASFQVAGTVAGVAVTQGQAVQAGQQVATLDPTLLQQQVTAAQSALTAAQARLTADENGQSTSTGSGAAGVSGTAGASAAAAYRGSPVSGVVLTSVSVPTGGSTGGSGGPAAGSGPAATGSPDLAREEEAVVSAQHRADVDLQTAAADLAAVPQACAGSAGPSPAPTTTTPTTTTPTTTVTPTTTPTTTVAPTTAPPSTTPQTTVAPTTTTTAPGGAGDACAAALSQAGADQQQVAADQQALAAAESTLARLLATEAASSGSSGAATGGSSGTQVPGTGKGTSTARSSAPSSAGTPAAPAPSSPAQLAGDEATIDTDSAALAQAEQALAGATLTSPISGTVASVAMTPGQTVTAGSGSATITIINSGSYQTTASLTTAQVQSVRVGDRASLTVDGATGSLEGTVSSVGPVDTGNSAYTYPVTIAVTSASGQLATGSTTRIHIDVAQAHEALVVPTSAVHSTSAAAAFVYLDQAGRQTRQRVALGVVGPVYTQIASGLKAGQTVILADPSQAVPASSTNSTARGFGGAGGIGSLLRGGLGGLGGTGTGGVGGLRTTVRGGGG